MLTRIPFWVQNCQFLITAQIYKLTVRLIISMLSVSTTESSYAHLVSTSANKSCTLSTDIKYFIVSTLHTFKLSLTSILQFGSTCRIIKITWYLMSSYVVISPNTHILSTSNNSTSNLLMVVTFIKKLELLFICLHCQILTCGNKHHFMHNKRFCGIHFQNYWYHSMINNIIFSYFI